MRRNAKKTQKTEKLRKSSKKRKSSHYKSRLLRNKRKPNQRNLWLPNQLSKKSNRQTSRDGTMNSRSKWN